MFRVLSLEFDIWGFSFVVWGLGCGDEGLVGRKDSRLNSKRGTLQVSPYITCQPQTPLSQIGALKMSTVNPSIEVEVSTDPQPCHKVEVSQLTFPSKGQKSRHKLSI